MAKKISELPDYIQEQVKKCHEQKMVATVTGNNKCSHCDFEDVFDSNFCGNCAFTFVKL